MKKSTLTLIICLPLALFDKTDTTKKDALQELNYKFDTYVLTNL